MKLIVLALCLLAFSCKNKEDEELKKAKELIENQKKVMYLDSIDIDRKMKIEIARKQLEQATGKKDTLTDAERLKKAEKDFQ